MNDKRSGLRPTRAGIYWLAAVVALLAAAINYSNNLIFAMTFVMFSLWLQAAWLCRRNVRGVRWQPGVPAPAFAGEYAGIAGTFVETGAYRRHALQLALSGASGESGDASVPVELAASAECRVDVSVQTARRGVFVVAPLALVSTYPFGWWCQRVALASIETLVYPKPAGDAALPSAAPVPAHRRYAVDNFQGVRRYAPGDPTRRINWRVFGRSGQLMVNQFDGASGGDALWLRWEQTHGDPEERVSQLAAWIVEAQRDGLDYGLQLGRMQLAPQHGAGHQGACLSALARFDASASCETRPPEVSVA